MAKRIEAKNSIIASTELAARTLKSGSFIFIGKVLSIIIQALMFIEIARAFGAGNYGVYTLVLSVAAFISAFGSLNIGTYFNERIPFLIAKKREHEIGTAIGDSLIAVILPGIALFAIGVLASGYISSVLHNTAPVYLIILALSSISFSFLYSTVNLILVGLNDGKNSAMGLIVYSIAQIILVVLLIHMGLGISGAIIAYIISLLVASIYQLVFIHKRYKISFLSPGASGRIKDMLKFSMPLTYSNIASTLVSNFAVILLGIFASTAVVGYYGVASRIGTLMDVFAGSIAVVLIPMFAEAIHSKSMSKKVGRFFYYSIYFGLLFTTPMIAYVTVFSGALITTLFHAEFSGAILPMQLIAIGMLIGTFGSFATQLVISTGKTSKVFKYSVIVAVIEVITLFVTVPFFSIFGVILALLYVGGMATNILFMNYIKELGINIKLGQVWKVAIANIILGLLLYVLLWAGSHYMPNELLILALGVISVFILYPPILAAIKAITEEDIKLIYNISIGIPFIGKATEVLISYTRIFL